MACFTSPNAPDAAIKTVGLSKTCAGAGAPPPFEALKSVDLTMPCGSFFALLGSLLGPNGAGISRRESDLEDIFLSLTKTPEDAA